MVNDRVFLVNASLGLYPQLLEDRETAQKQHHGRSRLIAAWAAMGTIMSGFRPLRITIERQGRKNELRTLTLFLANNRLQLEQMGLDATVIEDGKLAAIVLQPLSTPALFVLCVQGALKRLHKARAVDSFPLTRMTVMPAGRRTRRLKVAIDGEIEWMNAPLEFRVAPESLLLLKPIDAVPESAVS